MREERGGTFSRPGVCRTWREGEGDGSGFGRVVDMVGDLR
jgi:hypothetical protein